MAIVAAFAVLSTTALAAEPAAKSVAPSAKAAPTAPHKTAKAHAGKKAKVPLHEKFSCSTGPNDEQVRLIAEAVKGRAMEFAFYSRLGTRVCSIHSRRGDGLTRWEDAEGGGGKSLVRLLAGNALLEYESGHVKLTFSDVERMPYCGMYGDLNGVIEAVIKKPECGMQGLFEGANDPEPKVKPAAPAPPG
ncbi:MAG: hypothetical protein ABIS45_03775 [Burkholderiales bacterium]